MFVPRKLRPFIVCILCGAAAPALAQGAASGSTPGVRTGYDAAFFAAFAPSNALQIVERVPGFKLEKGDTEVRGFGRAAGNVVVNGQRPSTKSETLDVVLARIPASRVARVEVGPGDLFGSEFTGKPQVVNLILTDAGGLAGTATASVFREYTGALLPAADLSVLLRRGASTFSASAGIDNDQTGEEGSDRLTSLPDSRLIEFRRKVNETRDPNGFVSASWAHDAGANRTAHLNGRFAIDRFRLTQDNDVFPVAGPVRDDRLTQRYRRSDYELGGDVTRPFAGGGLKLVGLATRRDRLNREVSLNRLDPQTVLGGRAQTLDDRRDEAVARLVWNRQNLSGWNVEAGAEGAFNRLDSRVDLFDIDAAGSRTRVDLPVDRAEVKEYRGEAFVNAGRSLAPTLRADFGLTYEASELTVSGDAQAERSLRFLKPKATFDWQPAGGWHVQLAVARTVAQLLFEDFVSAAELTTERVNGGNPDLVPQRAWEILATAERPVFGDGLVKLELGYNFVGLVQDRVPTPEGFDAPGNLGDGRSFIARATTDTPLGRLGIKGGRLKLYASLVDTSVEDPYTLRDRRFSGNSLFFSSAEFRQDLGRWAWGFTLEAGTRSTFYRRNELDSSRSRIPYASVFVEYRPDARTTLTFGLDNAADSPGYRERTFFRPDRRTPDPFEFEFRERNRHVVPYLTLKRNFGG